MIENITLVALLRFLFQRFFQILEARFVLFFSKEGESQLKVNLSIWFFQEGDGFLEAVDRPLMFTLVVVASG